MTGDDARDQTWSPERSPADMTLNPLHTTINRPLEALFDGWWVLESQAHCGVHFTYKIGVVQVHTGDPIDIEYHRGPFPTKQDAENHALWDDVPGHFNHGIPVWADHCLGCGKFAKVLAGVNSAGWAWRVTECGTCGVLDSRITCQGGCR